MHMGLSLGLTARRGITAILDDVLIDNPGGSPWQPSDLTVAPKLWLKGDALTGTNGDALATWDDSGAANNDAIGPVTSTQRPTLVTSGLNSLNIARFNAANLQHLIPPFSLLSGDTEGSAFYVAKLNNDPPGTDAKTGPILGNFGTATDANHVPFTDGTVYEDFLSTVRKTTGNPTASLSAWHIAGFQSKASDWRFYANGGLEYSTVTNTVGANTSGGVGGPFIGKSAGAADNYFDGDLAEVIYVDSFLSQADREKVEGYLAHQCGITSVLDSGHPYKTVAPTIGGAGTFEVTASSYNDATNEIYFTVAYGGQPTGVEYNINGGVWVRGTLRTNTVAGEANYRSNVITAPTGLQTINVRQRDNHANTDSFTVTISEPDSGSDGLIDNPLAPPFIATSPSDPYTRDTGSPEHAIEFTASAGSEFDIFVHWIDADNYLKVEQRSNIIYAMGKVGGAPNDFRVLFGTEHGMAADALVRIEHIDGFVKLYRNTIEYPGFAFGTPGGGYATVIASQEMRVDWITGTVPATYTFSTQGVPFTLVDSNYSVVTDKATVDILYGDEPIGYEVYKNGSYKGRAILLSNTVAGEAQYETPALGVVGTENVEFLEVDFPDNGATFPVSQPIAATFGMNLAGGVYYGSERVQANMLRESGWQDKSAGYAEAPPGSTHVNADGQLISMGASGMFRGISKCETSGERCFIEYTGGAAATVSFYAEAPFSVANVVPSTVGAVKRIEYDFTHGGFNGTSGSLSLDITGMSSGDPIIILDAREVSRSTSEVFTSGYIARHSVYNGGLRLMEMMNANVDALVQADPPTWAERPLPGKLYAGLAGGGAPLEDLCDLVNAIAPPVAWFVPLMYTDDATIASMLNFLHDNIDPDIVIAIEPGNEPQNATFPLWNVMRDKAYTAGRITLAQRDDGGGYEGVLIEQAFQLTRWSNVLAAQDFPEGRFIRVMGVLGQGTYAVERMYEDQGCTAFDVVAHAPYIGATLMNDGPLGYTETTDLTVAFARLYTLFDRDFDELEISDAYIKSIGRRHWCYEGQQHYIIGGGATAPQIAFNDAFQADDRMREFIYDYCVRWASVCADLMTLFTSVGKNSQYGSWGFLPYQGANDAAAPKRTGLLEAIADT